MNKKVIPILIACLLLTSCQKDELSNPSVEPTTFTHTTTISETSFEEPVYESYTDVDMGVEITYAPNLLLSGTDINSADIYSAHYVLSPESISSHMGSDWSGLYEFVWNYYFGASFLDESMDSIAPERELVMQTVSSCELCDNNDISFVFPASGHEEYFENRLNSQDITFIVHNESVDGIPVCDSFESTSSDVYNWSGIVETSIFFTNDSILIHNGDQIMHCASGCYSDLSVIQEDVSIVEYDTISESVDAYINHTANMKMMTSAYVWGSRLMYIPLVAFSIEDNNHVGYEYIDYQNIVADVYLLPVWTVYYIGEYHGESQLYACFINAVTGDPLYSSEYSIYDPCFLIGEF